MNSKKDLMLKMALNDLQEIQEMINHSIGVLKFVEEKFPEEIPEHFMKSIVKSTDSALLGEYRTPEETGRMMLERIDDLKKRKIDAPGIRCPDCFWALYDGIFCQNPYCSNHGKKVKYPVKLNNEEALDCIANLKKSKKQ